MMQTQLAYADPKVEARREREFYDAVDECGPALRMRAAMLKVIAEEHDGDLEVAVRDFIHDEIDGRLIWDRCNGDADLVERVLKLERAA
jgi:hypothetical protein